MKTWVGTEEEGQWITLNQAKAEEQNISETEPVFAKNTAPAKALAGAGENDAAVIADGFIALTSAPTASGPDGQFKFVILNTAPSTYYSGYLYIILG